MKRLYTFFAAACLSTTAVAAQDYPEVSVHDIIRIPDDSLAAGSLRSDMIGDTVWVTGVVVVPTVLDPIDDRRQLMWAGSRWVSFLRDTNTALEEYVGINIVQADTSSAVNTLFDRVRPGDIIRALVRIGNFPPGPLGGTQTEIIKESQIEFLDATDAPDDALPVEIADFYTGPVGNQTANFTEGSKYIGRMVELSNVTVVSLTNFDYVLADSEGNEMYMRSQSGYFTKASESGSKPKLRPEFEGYKVGQMFDKVRGFITSSNVPGGVAAFMITPVYPEDVELSDVAPPEITKVERDIMKPFPSSSDGVPVSIYATKGSGNIASVVVSYSVDGGVERVTAATLSGDAYVAWIPAHPAGSLVRYTATVSDDNSMSMTYPLSGDFAYRVLDRPATIADVREHLSPSGYSAYDGFVVTLEGVVTATADDIPKDGNNDDPRIYIQNGTNPYSGIALKTNDPEHPLRAVSRGDRVQVTGTVDELFGNVTALVDITATEVLSGDNTVEPVQAGTTDFAGKQRGDAAAEQWESMLVEFTDVAVVRANADDASDRNFGEFMVSENPDAADGMRVETDDGDISLTTFEDNTEKTLVTTDMTFPYLRGIMYYSFGNYKLVPRSADDYQVVTDVAYSPDAALPGALRAFPNPFGGETTVEYMLASFAPSVRISLVDMQGRTVYSTVERNLPAGSYRFTLNASGLAAGVYRCAVESDGHRVSTHVVVVK